MFRFMFLLFLLIPLIEIYFLIQLGSVIGAAWTVIVVITTAIIGASLIKQQGVSTLQRAQGMLAQNQLPALEMCEGLVLFISGILLLTPGLMTDFFGFLLLIPSLRQAMINNALRNAQFSFRNPMQGHNQPRYDDSDIIEGEIIDDDRRDRHLK